ncbi:hypothetical protein E2C01_064640 [Portunus trituberculatus]|uniref:Uncharacterized protein n=1 Tax=Portunus trituberculatus TaxID=210409 RepID=A0A5B7HJP0_PORTR|nr:hypothetical protein [Portunus trituberculatus]
MTHRRILVTGNCVFECTRSTQVSSGVCPAAWLRLRWCGGGAECCTIPPWVLMVVVVMLAMVMLRSPPGDDVVMW